MIYFTELERLPAYDAKGDYLGRLADLVIDPNQSSLIVAAYLILHPQKKMFAIARERISSISVGALQTSVSIEEIQPYVSDEGMIRIKKDVLDQQIIDINNKKVVRVIDVDFDIQPSDRNTDLRIIAVNVGLAAAVRSLLRGLIAKHTARSLAALFPSKAIPWEFVDLIEPDTARRVKLRISYEKLAKLHPADIADILEELSREEQKSVIESLDDEVAAEAVSEIPTRMQVELLETLPAGKAADIVEEMDPDEAADVLQELTPKMSAEVLANMDVQEAKEVRDLLGFEENTAGGLMTTEFAFVADSATVADGINALKTFGGEPESIHALYLVDEQVSLTGVVPLASLLMAEKDRPLREIRSEPVLSVPFHADKTTVIDLFVKYNLVSLPIVDDDGRLLGAVTADDVLELVVRAR